MAYLGNQPLLSTMRTVAEGTAYANQTEIPVPGGLVSGMVDVVVNGADLAREDYDDTNGASIKLYVPMVVGSMFKVTAWTPNQTVVNAGGQLAGFRNKIINPTGVINQRGLGNTTTNGTYLSDRWVFECAGGVATKLQLGVDTTTSGVSAYSKSHLYLWSLTALTSPAAGDYGMFSQRIEGVNVADLMWGTASAKAVTVSFRATGPAGFVMPVTLRNGGGTRSYVKLITLSATPTTYSFTVAGDTTGTWLTDTQPGLSISFVGTAGTTWQAPAQNTWSAGNYLCASGNSNILSTTSQALVITDVQIEAGSVATPLEVRPFSVELAMCQRYYFKSYDYATTPGTVTSNGAVFWGYISNNRPVMSTPFMVTMRAIPSLTIYNPNSGATGSIRDFDATSDRGVTVNSTGNSNFTFYGAGTMTLGNSLGMHYTASAEL